MSMAALRWARGVRGITGAQKAVLLLLADMTNDEGECWPSVVGLAEDACMSERGTRDALRALEAASLLARVEGGGRHRTTLYRLAVQASETRQQVPPYRPRNPAAGAGNPEQTAGYCAEETRQPLPERGQQVPETRQLAPKRGQHLPPNPHEPSRTLMNPERRGRRGSRLPDDWQPSPDDAEFARTLRLDPQHVAAQFRDFWHAKAGKDAVKLDWPATWRGWCRREAERRPSPRASPGQQSKLAWLNGALSAESEPPPRYDLDLTAERIA